MNETNIIFFEEFKELDHLCGELYEAPYGVTHYIDDMKAVSENHYRLIPNWKADLKTLIRLRHIRNCLAHTEGAFYEDICTQNDIRWIQDFYQRILNQSDPLALRNQMSRKKRRATESNFDSCAPNRQMNAPNIKEPSIAYLILSAACLAAGILIVSFGILYFMQ